MVYPITFPTIHPNGSGAANLLRQQEEVLDALYGLEGALRNAMPHDRDYYLSSASRSGTVARQDQETMLAEVERLKARTAKMIEFLMKET
jgi:hypothetical protein